LEHFLPAENRVDIWRIDVAVGNDRVQACRRLLSPDEAKRADRFYFEQHRFRFTVFRAAMRLILSRYLGLPPQEIVFCYGPRGKPECSEALERPGIKFNLSHSDQVALLAVTQGLAVGVDIELVDHEFASQEIAERFFSPAEVRRLRALSPTERAGAFFACWTRKEAYIKALGDGLSVPLDSFEVAFSPGIEAALLNVRGNPTEVARWSMYDIQTTAEFRAALVVEGKDHQLRHLHWDEWCF
jgi:4'-phosphopantetheinyl transferase